MILTLVSFEVTLVPHLQELDDQCKPHRDVDQLLVHLLAHSFHEDRYADYDEKGQGQNFYRDVLEDEILDWLGEKQNDYEGEQHGDDDYPFVARDLRVRRWNGFP